MGITKSTKSIAGKHAATTESTKSIEGKFIAITESIAGKYAAITGKYRKINQYIFSYKYIYIFI